MMTSEASLVMSPDDTSKASWPICIRYTPRVGDDTWLKEIDPETHKGEEETKTEGCSFPETKKHQFISTNHQKKVVVVFLLSCLMCLMCHFSVFINRRL